MVEKVRKTLQTYEAAEAAGYDPLQQLHCITIPQLSLCLFTRIPDNRALVMVGALPVRFF
jgi:hypothetical protein